MKIVPSRIIEARKELMYTQTKLAELSGISRTTVSMMEKGLVLQPSPQIIISLSRILRKPQAFFFTENKNNLTDTTKPTFRSFKAKTKASNGVAEIKIERAKSFIQYLYDRIKPRYIDFAEFFVESPEYLLDEDIEGIALNIRHKWNMGEDPFKGLVTLLENHGIICCSINLPDKIDSVNVSFTRAGSNKETALIIYSDRLNYFRQRFSLAHELGHIILHHYIDDEIYESKSDLLEKQANRFASAFLLPAQRFIGTTYATTLNGAKALKGIWKVSIAAIIHRFQDLNLISKNQIDWLNIEMSRKGWKKIEPMDNETPVEIPYYMAHAYRFVFDRKLSSPKEIIGAFNLYESDIVEYIGNNDLFISTKPILSFESFKSK